LLGDLPTEGVTSAATATAPPVLAPPFPASSCAPDGDDDDDEEDEVDDVDDDDEEEEELDDDEEEDADDEEEEDDDEEDDELELETLALSSSSSFSVSVVFLLLGDSGDGNVEHCSPDGSLFLRASLLFSSGLSFVSGSIAPSAISNAVAFPGRDKGPSCPATATMLDGDKPSSAFCNCGFAAPALFGDFLPGSAIDPFAPSGGSVKT
jgi:hypothetical protein